MTVNAGLVNKDFQGKTKFKRKLMSDEGVLEATSGFEPLNRGFADPCLATWLRRPAKD